MTDPNIPISQSTLAKLQEMARWAGVSVNEVLDQAVKAHYDRRFWEEVNAGYAALRADPAAWAEIQTERKLWDRTLMDGLDPSERWTADGNLIPPAEQEHAS